MRVKMFKALLTTAFHAETYFASLATPRRQLNLHLSYVRLSSRCTSTKDTCVNATRKDLKKEPKEVLKMVTEEALYKFNRDMNLKYSSVQSCGLWLSSVEIEWPEKIKLSGVAIRKKESQKIAAKNMLKILTEKNVISNTAKLIEATTFCPQTQQTNINGVIVFPSTELSRPRLHSEVSDDRASSFSSSDSLNSLLNGRNYSGCYGFGQNEAILTDLIERFQNMSIRSFHNSSSHDDKSESNKIAIKRKAENENAKKVSVPCNIIKAKRKKKDKVRRSTSLKLNNAKIVPVSSDSHSKDLMSGDLEGEKIAVKTEQTGELEDLQVSGVTSNPNIDSEKHFSIMKDEDDSSHNDASKDSNMDIAKEELEIIEGKYPHPKGTLNNIYALVAQELKDSVYKVERSYRVVPVYTGKKATKTMWCCTYKVKWPSEAVFSSTMSNKALAGKQAALKTLHWLQMQGKLTKQGAPQLYDPTQIKAMMKIPTEVTVDPAVIGDIDKLITYYNKYIYPLLDELQMSEKSSDCSDKSDIEDVFTEDENINSLKDLFGNDEPTNPITGFSFRDTDSRLIAQRNNELYNRYLKRTSSENREREMSKALPIAKFKSQIVKMVEDNQVLVIKGEPGCGKSTQVPQYLMEHWEASEKGAHCNVIITQPRRISAISLAEWVAYERQERVGDVVGYQVRLKAALPKQTGGALLFCSTGILLRRLQSNPGLFGASHVILDEAHERDINTDMLLVLLQRALSLNPKLRVIVMSATINAELFQKYFGDAAALHIPGFTHPVKSLFLEDLEVRSRISNISEHPTIDPHLVADTIKWIDRNRPEGAILCFLPGWAEITSVSKLLSDNSYCVILVHSRLTHAEQRRIFHVPPPGVRKIILSTNITETSITINDVKYVVDTGAHKEERLNVNLGVSSLDNHWVSQANVRQRRGRAGRVQPGECFHLYTREKFESLDQFPIPELLRVPLEKTVLDLKTYSQEEKAKEFLAEMPEPPSVAAVAQAVNVLNHLGALDENERLTPLGRRIALFSTHPKLSKALVLAAIFRCVSPMLTIATVLSGDAELFVGGLNNKENVRLTKRRFHPSSDHVSMAWLYQEWEMMRQKSNKDANSYCYSRSLNSDNLNTVSKLRKLYSDQIWQSRMLEDSEEYKDLDSPINKYSGNDELVKAVFYLGTGTLLYRRSWDVKNGRMLKNTNVILTEAGRRTTLASESVNFKRADFPSPFLTYFREVESTERRTVTVRETSILSPLTVLLFSEGFCTVNKFDAPQNEEKWNNHVTVKINRNKRDVTLLCESSVVQKLLDLRDITWSMVDYFVLKNGVEDDDERYKTICSYHDGLLKLLSKMLYRAGALIEYDEEGNLRK